jgi:hypothetical protein
MAQKAQQAEREYEADKIKAAKQAKPSSTLRQANKAPRPESYEIAIEYFDTAIPTEYVFDGHHPGSVARLRDRS